MKHCPLTLVELAEAARAVLLSKPTQKELNEQWRLVRK